MADGNNNPYQPFGPFLEGRLRGERAWEILASCNYDLVWLRLLAYNVMSTMEEPENNIEILQPHILQHATLRYATPQVYQIVAELRRREAKIAKEQTSVRDLGDVMLHRSSTAMLWILVYTQWNLLVCTPRSKT